MSNDPSEVASALEPTTKQQFFMRYFTAILVDLVVLNLFAEFWGRVVIDSFLLSLFAAVMLQVMLKVTLHYEHRVINYFKARPGPVAKILRWFCAWLILFGSKFVILYALHLAFGDAIAFLGPMHGVGAFIAVIVAMLVAEEMVVRFYRYLGNMDRRSTAS